MISVFNRIFFYTNVSINKRFSLSFFFKSCREKKSRLASAIINETFSENLCPKNSFPPKSAFNSQDTFYLRLFLTITKATAQLLKSKSSFSTAIFRRDKEKSFAFKGPLKIN